MGYKADDSCLAKVADDEPIFVLRGQDLLAPELVRRWAELAVCHGLSPEKFDKALKIAADMERWSPRKYPD